jgi:hypothetical protein
LFGRLRGDQGTGHERPEPGAAQDAMEHGAFERPV